MPRYIGVYTDRGMTTELPEILIDGKLVPLLKLGNLDISEDLAFPLYIENQSSGTIENLKIGVEPIKRKGVSINVVHGDIPYLERTDVHEIIIKWTWGEGVRTGPFRAVLSIKGVVTRELV